MKDAFAKFSLSRLFAAFYLQYCYALFLLAYINAYAYIYVYTLSYRDIFAHLIFGCSKLNKYYIYAYLHTRYIYSLMKCAILQCV